MHILNQIHFSNLTERAMRHAIQFLRSKLRRCTQHAVSNSFHIQSSLTQFIHTLFSSITQIRYIDHMATLDRRFQILLGDFASRRILASSLLPKEALIRAADSPQL